MIVCVCVHRQAEMNVVYKLHLNVGHHKMVYTLEKIKNSLVGGNFHSNCQMHENPFIVSVESDDTN